MSTSGLMTPGPSRSGPMVTPGSASIGKSRSVFGGRKCATLPLKRHESSGSLASMGSLQTALGYGSGRKANTLRANQFRYQRTGSSRSSLCSTTSSVAFPSSAAALNRSGGVGRSKGKTVAPKVRVMVRIRPPGDGNMEVDSSTGCIEVMEAVDDESECMSSASSVAGPSAEDNLGRATLRVQNKNYTFDRVFLPHEDQERVFVEAGKPIADSALEGFNASVFAYGQTGSGKTHTMQGGNSSENASFGDARGLIPRMLDYCFMEMSKLKEAGATVVATVQYLEIYNELVYDLLDSPTEYQASQPGFVAPSKSLRENTQQGVFVAGAVKENIETSEEATALIMRGQSSRHVASTNMNRESSRSHSIFTLELQIKTPADDPRDKLEVTRSSKINLVDLAGSERQSSTQATGDRLNEAKSINKSLSSLGMVISALSKSDRGGFSSINHIPYRDSKLTHLLRDSLGGNTMTSIIATVSADNTNVFDTTSTLQFGKRAKKIRLLVQANTQQCSDVPTLRKEIRRLKAELERAQSLHQGVSAEPVSASSPPQVETSQPININDEDPATIAAHEDDVENNDPNNENENVIRKLTSNPDFVRVEKKLFSHTKHANGAGNDNDNDKDSNHSTMRINGQTVLRKRIVHLERVLLELLEEFKGARARRSALDAAKTALHEEVDVLRDELDLRCNATACGAEERVELVKEAVNNVELARVVRQNRELLLQLEQAAALGTTELAVAARARAVEELQEQHGAVLMDKIEMEQLVIKREAKLEELKKELIAAQNVMESDALCELREVRLELRGAKEKIGQLEEEAFMLHEERFPPSADKVTRRHSETQSNGQAQLGSPSAGAYHAVINLANDAFKSAANAVSTSNALAAAADGADLLSSTSSLRPLNLGPLMAAAATSSNPPLAPHGAMPSTGSNKVPSAQELVEQRLAKHAFQKEKDLARIKKELRRKSLQCEEAKKDYRRVRQSLTCVSDQFTQGTARNVELEVEVQRLRKQNERLLANSQARQVDIQDKDQRIEYLEKELDKLRLLAGNKPNVKQNGTPEQAKHQPSVITADAAAAAPTSDSSSKKKHVLASTMSVGEFFPTNTSEESTAALQRARKQDRQQHDDLDATGSEVKEDPGSESKLTFP